MTGNSGDKRLYQVALLVSLACVLQISESMIPHPIPGLRLGLANMITLTALYVLGFRYALEIAIMRTILSSLIIGSFMSPTFILSLSSAVASTLLMGLFHWLSVRCRWLALSIVGISVIGAFAHNMVQLYLAYMILVRHAGVFVFFPWLSVGAIATGLITGVVAAGVCRRIENMPAQKTARTVPATSAGPRSRVFVPGDSPVHRFPPEIKIFILLTLSLAVLVFDDPWLYSQVFVFLCAASLLSRTPPTFLLSRLKKFSFLIVLTFLLPVFFHAGGQVAFQIWKFQIASEGLLAGAVYASRIVLLIMACSLLMRTTSIDEMTRGLATALRPVKWIGVDEKRAAAILSLSWAALPYLWESARSTIKNAKMHKVENLRNLIPRLSELVSELYLRAEPEQATWVPAETKARTEVVSIHGKDGNDRKNDMIHLATK